MATEEKEPRRANVNILKTPGSMLEKYMRRFVGSSRYRDLLKYEIAAVFFRNFPGAAGVFLRQSFYPCLIGKMGAKAVFLENVNIRCPKRLYVGAQTAIDVGVCFDIKSENALVRIGSRCQIAGGVRFETGYEGFVTVGADSFVGAYTILNGQGGIAIGKNALIGGHCHLVAGNHGLFDADTPISQQAFTSQGIVLEDNVWLGAGVTILDGVMVGKGAVVAAGAVVNGDVESGTIVAGVPAKFVKKRESNF